jgi:hypothetical protein
VTLGFERIVGGYTTLDGAESTTRSASCPSGYFVVGGGWEFEGVPSNDYVLVQESFASDADTWSLRIHNGTAASFRIRPVITCIRVTP